MEMFRLNVKIDLIKNSLQVLWSFAQFVKICFF